MRNFTRTILTCSILLTLCFNAGAQSRTITVDFNKSDQLVSPAFTIDADVEKFAGMSAYSSNLNPDYTLAYAIEIGGRWSEWKYFKHYTEEATPGRQVFEADPIPYSFHAIRFKANQPAGVVHFRMFFPKFTGAMKDEPAPLIKDAACSCTAPVSCDRSCWCPSGNCPKDTTPTATYPTHFIIHHSAGFNTSNDYKAVVAYYWDFHTKTNGWDDIGYNWLIDPNGVVYEGRGDKVLGAHFSCMNGGTLGICLIGDFTNQPPTQAAINSLEELLAGLCCEYMIDPLGIAYHASSQLNLPRISSHRDGNNSPAPNSCASGTECPGDMFYPMLQTVRDETAAKPCLALRIEKQERAPFTLASNPGNGLEIIIPEDGKYELSVFNAMGQFVMSASIDAMANRKTSVDMVGSPGIYLVRLDHLGKTSHLLWEKR